VLIQKGSLSQSLQNGLLQAKAFEEKKVQGYSSQLANKGGSGGWYHSVGSPAHVRKAIPT